MEATCIVCGRIVDVGDIRERKNRYRNEDLRWFTCSSECLHTLQVCATAPITDLWDFHGIHCGNTEDKCPYCGDVDVKWAIHNKENRGVDWSVHCNTCGKEETGCNDNFDVGIKWKQWLGE